MGVKKRFNIVLSTLFLILLIASVVNMSINMRDYGIKSATDKAKLTAEIVRDGLTAHMVNGIMDQREFFLRKIETSENIDSLWVTRSKSVIKQFGEGFNNEVPRDDIDRSVLNSGEIIKKVIETSNSAKLRVTIPYVATSFGNPDCLSCHEAKEQEVLGTVSMVFNLQEMRSMGIMTTANIALITALLLIISLIVSNRFFSPFLNLFESITHVLQKAHSGNYSKKVVSNAGPEGDNVAKWINTLLEKLQDTLDEIDKEVDSFMVNKSDFNKTTDPLIGAKNIIHKLSDIYKFKKTIELDASKQEIYERLAYIIQHTMDVKKFAIVEINRTKMDAKVVYESQKDLFRCRNIENCRSLRNNTKVSSDTFDFVCKEFKLYEKYEHLCMTFTLNSYLSLVLHILADDQEELSSLKKRVPTIENYIDSAKPEIVSKELTYILKESSIKDQLTGFYNRKFLDEFTEKSIPQALRSNCTYGVLMVDIDYFKMINDTYGHDVGDVAIRVVSQTIRNSIRESDVPVRFGGEEFLVLLYNCDDEMIVNIAEKIRTTFSQTVIQADGNSFSKTLSIGCSMFPTDSESIWKVIKYADIALYEAKHSGRNKVVRFSKELIPEGTGDDSY